MESRRNIICGTCRQRLGLGVVVKAENKGGAIVCPSCRTNNVLPLPSEEPQTCQQHQGLGSRIRSFGSHLKTKLYPGATVPPPSLNHQPSNINIPNPTRSNKRAVLCGITYNDRNNKLKGTINDVKNIRDLLITKFGYPREFIRVLTEEEKDQRFIPTKKNIEDSLRWLVNDCQSGDSLVFFYSGHGIRQPDFNNDEDDGFDETLCPVDFMKSGMILDNDLNSLIVRPLNPGVTLHAIVDACHSGTILDLPHVYFSLENKWKDNFPPSGVDKLTNGGLAISISACLDNQDAVDTSAFNGKMNGALTFLFAEVLKKLPGPTYGDLFNLIHESMDNVNKSGCFASSRILRRFFNNRFSQTPLLSSSHVFDVYKKHLFL